MNVTLTLRSAFGIHLRESFLQRNPLGEIYHSITITGQWVYLDFHGYSPSYHLSGIESTISFHLSSVEKEKTIFWIDKFKSSITKSYVTQIAASIGVSNSELDFMGALSHADTDIQIDIELDFDYRTPGEQNLIDIIKTVKERNKTVRKDFKIIGYSIKQSTPNSFLKADR